MCCACSCSRCSHTGRNVDRSDLISGLSLSCSLSVGISLLIWLVWAWSIFAMHPILRIFVYHNHGSLRLSGSCGPHAQGGVGSGAGTICNNMPYEPCVIVTMCYQLLPCSRRSGSLLPGHYQCLPAVITIPNTPGGVHVRTPTKPYQTLPPIRSGSAPALCDLYQHPTSAG